MQQSLSKVNGRKPYDLLTAARHNTRQIQAELGSVGRINPVRSANNIVMYGPASAAEVQSQADALLAGAGIDTRKLRRNHCQAIEAVFSLPPDAAVTDPIAYFACCLEWVAGAMRLPMLNAVLHLHEQAPRLHVLLLPVKGRAYVGSAPTDRIELKQLRDGFFALVTGPAGLQRQSAKVRGKVREWAVAAVLHRCRLWHACCQQGAVACSGARPDCCDAGAGSRREQHPAVGCRAGADEPHGD